MKRLTIVLILFFVISCGAGNSKVNVNNVSWTKVSAYTNCKMSYGTPSCSVSIDMPGSKLHNHFLETNVKEIRLGETLKLSTFDKDSRALKSVKIYKIVDIILEGDSCRLIINPTKYEDEFISVEGCSSS